MINKITISLKKPAIHFPKPRPPWTIIDFKITGNNQMVR